MTQKMSPQTRPPRVVLDTNVVLSALLFTQGRLAWLRGAWQAGRVTPLVSRATTAELLRALAYPKFGLSAAEQETLLGDYLPWCETVNPSVIAPPLPACRDPHDAIFLELAQAAGADALVSGDEDLLSLAGVFAVPILAPQALREW